MAAGDLNINQFKQQVLPGQLDLSLNPTPNVFTMRIDPASSAFATVGAKTGQGLKLKDLGGSDVNGVPIVDAQTADTDYVLGVRVYDTKNGKVTAGNIVQVASQGAVVWMKYKTTLLRGVAVACDSAVPGQVLALTTGKYVFGVTLDHAVTAGDLGRVLITATGLKYSGVST
jgi:hypothetical protein